MLDKQTLLSDQQSLIAAVGTVVSTNAIDLGVTGAVGTDDVGNKIFSDPGRSSKIELLCQIVDTVLASGGAATITFQLISSANANLSSPTVINQTTAISKASLVAGYKARLAIPPGISERYLGAQYVIATNDITAGKVTCGVVDVVDTAYSI